MSIRASGRSALIIAAGVWLGLAGPMRATDSAAEPAGQAAQTEKAGAPVKLSKFSKHRAHKRHVARTRKSTKATSKKDVEADKAAKASAQREADKQMPLPPTVANANAQMPGTPADEPKTEAGALANSAGKMLATNQAGFVQPQADPTPATTAADPVTTAAANVVPADELNDVDRAMADDKQAAPAPTLALASLDTPASAANGDTTTGQSLTSEDSAWSQTSLIGKIFIAFGGLLTLASAARMFMA